MSTQTSSQKPDARAERRCRVVVGVEYADRNPGAIAWAAAEAATHGASLEIVSACPVALGPVPGHPPAYIAANPTETRRESLSRMVERLRPAVDVLTVTAHIGSPTQVLLDAVGEDVETLVVGRRGLGAVGSALLGSTSIAVAGRSPVPVVVVEDGWTAQRHSMFPIVAGVALDDPEQLGEVDEGILRFAFSHARELEVPLIVVHTCEIPVLSSRSPADINDFRGRRLQRLQDLIEPIRVGFPQVEVIPSAVAERPVDAILNASRIAQLAVVGRKTPDSRLAGGLHLGSTTRAVLHRARTPIAVVPATAHKSSPAHHRGDVWGPMH